MIAVDVGNARIKLGWFDRRNAAGLPEPRQTLALDNRSRDFAALSTWLEGIPAACEASPSWRIASVNRPAATRLLDWLRSNRPQDRIALLAAGDLPLAVELPRPDMVGVDRLLDAVAANVLRPPNRPAVVVDVGTAITVDLRVARGGLSRRVDPAGHRHVRPRPARVHRSAAAFGHFRTGRPAAGLGRFDRVGHAVRAFLGRHRGRPPIDRADGRRRPTNGDLDRRGRAFRGWAPRPFFAMGAAPDAFGHRPGRRRTARLARLPS